MSSGNAGVSTAGTLTLTATYTGASDYAYDSGTVYAKQQFTVEETGGLDFSADFIAPVAKGTWVSDSDFWAERNLIDVACLLAQWSELLAP